MMNGYPKYVVSTTLEKAEWNNSTIFKENVSGAVSGLKQQPGKDILAFALTFFSATAILTLIVILALIFVLPEPEGSSSTRRGRRRSIRG
jgi:hypothetical protein